MITIISGTNRKDSNTLKIAIEYRRLLDAKNIPSKILNLQNFPKNLLTDMMYDSECAEFSSLQEEYFFGSDKFIFVTPEYNGSIPGVLKVLLDASDLKKGFYNKKALLVGTATGRAGNLRGLDHLTAILNNMHVNVHWNKLPISRVHGELSAEGMFHNEATLRAVEMQLEAFLNF